MLQPRCGNYCTKIERERKSDGPEDTRASLICLQDSCLPDLTWFWSFLLYFLHKKLFLAHYVTKQTNVCTTMCERGDRKLISRERPLNRSLTFIHSAPRLSVIFARSSPRSAGWKMFHLCRSERKKKKKSLITLHICVWFLLKLSNYCFPAFIPRPPDASQLTAAEENRQRWPSSWQFQYRSNQND